MAVAAADVDSGGAGRGSGGRREDGSHVIHVGGGDVAEGDAHGEHEVGGAVDIGVDVLEVFELGLTNEIRRGDVRRAKRLCAAVLFKVGGKDGQDFYDVRVEDSEHGGHGLTGAEVYRYGGVGEPRGGGGYCREMLEDRRSGEHPGDTGKESLPSFNFLGELGGGNSLRFGATRYCSRDDIEDAPFLEKMHR